MAWGDDGVSNRIKGAMIEINIPGFLAGFVERTQGCGGLGNENSENREVTGKDPTDPGLDAKQ